MKNTNIFIFLQNLSMVLFGTFLLIDSLDIATPNFKKWFISLLLFLISLSVFLGIKNSVFLKKRKLYNKTEKSLNCSVITFLIFDMLVLFRLLISINSF